jgi:NOL1/NOP2/sun family putative RNA methylase
MQHLLGPEATQLLEALSQPPVTGLRVNTLKLSTNEFENLWSSGYGVQGMGYRVEGLESKIVSKSPTLYPLPFTLHPVPWSSSGFVIPNNTGAGKHPFHAAGLYYLQEPSAMAVAETLQPQPNELVLDLAAAPGGKTTHIAALTKNKSIVVANEVNHGRTKALAENLERTGSTRAVITSEDVQRLAKHWSAIFDRVLLDAPCSGEGMFRKSPEALAMWSETTILGCAKRQASLINEAAHLVKVGGYLVYSTCTFAPEENEYVIAKFLKDQPEFELCEIKLGDLEPTSHGRPDWLPDDLHNSNINKTMRLFPHQVLGEGHFVAKLQKTSGETTELIAATFNPVSKDSEKKWLEFCRITFASQPVPDMQLTFFGEKLFAVPEGVPNLRGIKALKTGLWLGTFQGTGQKARFEPAHSLALALGRRELGDTLEFTPTADALKRYLQGYELESQGEDGWLVITVAGFPLGWGRRSKGIVKNAYPKGSRLPS